jgi:hypothetical protein
MLPPGSSRLPATATAAQRAAACPNAFQNAGPFSILFMALPPVGGHCTTPAPWVQAVLRLHEEICFKRLTFRLVFCYNFTDFLLISVVLQPFRAASAHGGIL